MEKEFKHIGINNNMNILKFIPLVFFDGWTISGLISTFLLHFVFLQANLTGFTEIFKAIGIVSSLAGIVITLLSVFRIYIKTKREFREYQDELADMIKYTNEFKEFKAFKNKLKN